MRFSIPAGERFSYLRSRPPVRYATPWEKRVDSEHTVEVHKRVFTRRDMQKKYRLMTTQMAHPKIALFSKHATTWEQPPWIEGAFFPWTSFSHLYVGTMGNKANCDAP